MARLTHVTPIRAQIGYKRRSGYFVSKPSLAVGNTLDWRFELEAPSKAWVADTTYIGTHEGCSYLAVVLDLFSRRIVGWSMQARQTTNVVLAVDRRVQTAAQSESRGLLENSGWFKHPIAVSTILAAGQSS